MFRFLATASFAMLLLLPSCSGDVRPDTTATSIEPGSRYCFAMQTMMLAQPDGRLSGNEFIDAMTGYADAVQVVAEMAPDDDAVILWELAATARKIAADPGDRVQAQRLGAMAPSVAEVTLPASAACGFAQ